MFPSKHLQPKKLQKEKIIDGNQVEDAQAHEAQAQQGAQAQRITRSMTRPLGQEYQKMTLLISIV